MMNSSSLPSPSDCWIIVPAAGIGSRMNADIPKQYLPLAGKTVLQWTLERLLKVPGVKGIVVSVRGDDQHWAELALSEKYPQLTVVAGGDERHFSVLNALNALESLADADDWVLVHDAARPCINLQDISALRHKLQSHAVGGILATPVSDTLKQVAKSGSIESTVDRSVLWQAQTPQQFRYGLLRSALLTAQQNNYPVTDESSAIERTGYQPLIIEGRRDNLKITRPEDLALAGWILQQQEIAQ